MVEDRARVRGQVVLVSGERRFHLARIARAQRDESLLLRRREQLGLFARVGGKDVERRGGIGFGELLRRLELATIDGKRLVERRSEEHTSELQSLMRISYAVL